MSHGTEHHLEESHHAEHASHDEFNKRVAMTMAIIAAALAFVTLQSHRAHNMTLQKRIESGVKKTEATDRWTQYQAKKIRSNDYAAFIDMMAVLAVRPGKEAAAEDVRSRFKEQVTRYTKTKREEEENPADPKELLGLEEVARELEKESKEFLHESDQYHHRAERFDTGELGIEFGLVLCSVAVLTKRALFWLLGITGAAVGFLVTLSAYVPFLMQH